jgi:hypothetical protein
MEDFKVNKPQKTEEQEVREARKEITLVDSARMIPGLNVFELNLKTFGVKQIAPMSKEEELVERRNMITGRLMTGFGSKTKIKYRVKENCLYIQATNSDRAGKKFERFLDKSILEENFSKKVGK